MMRWVLTQRKQSEVSWWNKDDVVVLVIILVMLVVNNLEMDGSRVLRPMSDVVVDTNPYSRLLALKKMG